MRQCQPAPKLTDIINGCFREGKQAVRETLENMGWPCWWQAFVVEDCAIS